MRFTLTVDHTYTARHTIVVETEQEDESYLEQYDNENFKGDIDGFIENIKAYGDKIISDVCEESFEECDVSSIVDIE